MSRDVFVSGRCLTGRCLRPIRRGKGKKTNPWEAVHNSISSIFDKRQAREAKRVARETERELKASKRRGGGGAKDEL